MEPLKTILARLQAERQKQTKNGQSQTLSHVDCEICNDTELEVVWDEESNDWLAKACKCKEQKSINRMFRNSGIDPEQRAYTLNDYRVTPENKELFDIAKNYMAELPEIYHQSSYNKGLALMGTVGTGKTMLATIVANKYMAHRIPVTLVITADLMAELRQSQFGEARDLEERIKRLVTTPVVFFDDIGKEKATEWVQDQYFRIVDGRYRSKLTTIFTTNLSFRELGSRLGDAVVSRLYEMTRDRQVVTKAKDYRKFGERRESKQIVKMEPGESEKFYL